MTNIERGRDGRPLVYLVVDQPRWDTATFYGAYATEDEAEARCAEAGGDVFLATLGEPVQTSF